METRLNSSDMGHWAAVQTFPMIGGGGVAIWGIEWFAFRPTPLAALPLAVYA